MAKRKIFVAYHADDELEVTVFCRRYAQYFSEIRTLGIAEEGETYAEKIESGDSDYVMRRIRERKLAGTSCTVVLIGKCTWARRYVDWEIAATLKTNTGDPRGGLIAVQLPTAAENGFERLPPRLELNLVMNEEGGTDAGYARSYGPPPSDGTIAAWVEAAARRRDSMEPAEGSTSALRVRSSPCS
ncbi:MAG TPA: TIR domain-containing protein [Acidimicrobiales bacterium]|nr:TIR domain-containing protein [Acidimicrobiales bacterium]